MAGCIMVLLHVSPDLYTDNIGLGANIPSLRVIWSF